MSRLTPLRIALLSQDRTQKWLAEEVGKSEPVISRIVNGLHCDDATQQKIAAALELTPEDLWPADEPKAAA